MQTRKSVDWLEFVFDSQLRGVAMELIETDVSRNYGRYNRYRSGRYELWQNTRKNHNWLVQWTGKNCATFDPLEEIWTFAEYTGVGLVDIKIKRLDIAFDLCCEMQFIDRDLVQCRAKYYGYHRSNGETHVFGRSPLLLRIYDKRAERQARRADLWPHFLETSGFPDGPVTRFEFMLRNEGLRKRGIESAAELATEIRELESYLVRDWFWIPATKNRKGKIPTREWSIIQGMVQHEYSVTPKEKKGVDSRTLKRSGFGSLASAYCSSLSWNETPTEEGYKAFIQEALEGFIPDQGWHSYLGDRT